MTPKDEELKATDDDGNCVLCGERTNSLHGNPGLWCLWFTEPDGTGTVRPHHVHCVQKAIAKSRHTPELEELKRRISHEVMAYSISKLPNAMNQFRLEEIIDAAMKK